MSKWRKHYNSFSECTCGQVRIRKVFTSPDSNLIERMARDRVSHYVQRDRSDNKDGRRYEIHRAKSAVFRDKWRFGIGPWKLFWVLSSFKYHVRAIVEINCGCANENQSD